jgi:phosphoglycerate dehydrogenase-like enzyme
MARHLIVTFDPDERGKSIIAETIAGAADIVYIAGLDAAARAVALRTATVVLTRNTATELRRQELALLGNVALVQLVPAGIDFIPLGDLPPSVRVASNAGAYSRPIAEHAVAMVLAAAKRLLAEHAALTRGEFNQPRLNRMLAGAVCGVLGFGGIGKATARIMRCLGMRIHAINRRGASEEAVDWIGTMDRLDELLSVSDVIVISLPLTRATNGLIRARELGLMKPDAILVNLARGEIIDEAAFYEYLKSHPAFTACIDAWWIEPVRHGEFRMDQPFMQLPNVIGSPHNSASVVESRAAAIRGSSENCRRALLGEEPLNLVGPDDRLL